MVRVMFLYGLSSYVSFLPRVCSDSCYFLAFPHCSVDVPCCLMLIVHCEASSKHDFATCLTGSMRLAPT